MSCSCGNPAFVENPDGTFVLNKRLVEFYDGQSGLPIYQTCVECPLGTAVISESVIHKNGNIDQSNLKYSTAGATFILDPFSCVPCPDPNMYFDKSYRCKCKDGYKMVGVASIGPQSCIIMNPTLLNNYADVKFNNDRGLPISLQSIIFSHFYLKVASGCEYAKGEGDAILSTIESCQTLANLCVMNMYDERSIPCAEYQMIVNKRLTSYHGQEGWKTRMPWLYYLNDSNDVLGDRGIKLSMSFADNRGRESTLDFRLIKYSLGKYFYFYKQLCPY
eukprot:CAMPEP_0184870910 /NCGR_PEP_ID=MMETSP0580-20130426/39207_1 /TAXON_ID=1118495 /ORGANISM="Dactyliosolen fragilissimus" /LENGTH=275 /DNA_ID=CAMNT_0027373279 /DNA_START=237 /DNA_END=1064 /DNA_ORIENTATION=+